MSCEVPQPTSSFETPPHASMANSPPPTSQTEADKVHRRRIVEGSFEKAVEVGSLLISDLENRSARVARLRGAVQPFVQPLADHVHFRKRMEQADTLVIDPVLNALGSGKLWAAATEVFQFFRDFSYGILCGLFVANEFDEFAADKPSHQQKPKARWNDAAVLWRPFALALAWISPGSNLRSESYNSSYTYRVGWEFGNWITERAKHVYYVYFKPTVVPRFLNPEINLANIGECLARHLPLALAEKIPQIREALVCQRRRATNTEPSAQEKATSS